MAGVYLFSIKKKRQPAYKKRIALTLSYRLEVFFLNSSNSRSSFHNSFAVIFLLISKKERFLFAGSTEVIVSIKTFICCYQLIRERIEILPTLDKNYFPLLASANSSTSVLKVSSCASPASPKAICARNKPCLRLRS